MKWSFEDIWHSGVRGSPGPTRYFIELECYKMDGLILQAADEIRWCIESHEARTPWADMTPAPEGMELEDVKKLVESVLRLKGAA